MANCHHWVLLQATVSSPALPEVKSRLLEPMFFHELKKTLSMALDFMEIRRQSGLFWDFI